MVLYLNNGGTATYNDKSQIEHVTYLPGIGMKVYIKGQAESVDYLYSQLEKIEYTIENSNNTNANWTMVGVEMWEDYPEAWRQRLRPAARTRLW